VNGRIYKGSFEVQAQELLQHCHGLGNAQE
jgi:hypothetical protein